MPEKIAVANQKGGVGKTTTCIELAFTLKDAGQKVLLIDLDQQGNLSDYLNADRKKPTIYECLHAKCAIIEATQNCKGVDIITSSPALSKADREFIDTDDMFLLSDLIEATSDNYDYVIIDNSPSRSVLLNMSYVAADYVLIPSECDAGSLNGVTQINRDIIKLRDGRVSYSHARIIGVVLTKYENTIMHQTAVESLKEITDEIDPNIFIAKIRKSIVVSECKTLKMPLQAYNKYSNPAIDYRNLSKQIMKEA